MERGSGFDLNQLYEQLITGLPIHIYWKDVSYRYIYCNQLQAENFGFKTPDEIIGKTDYDILSKEEADALRKNDKRVIETGKPCIFEETTSTTESKFVFLTQKIPIILKNKIVGVAGISLDITVRKKNEEKILLELKNSERTLNDILDNLPGHVYWKDKDGVFLGCNRLQVTSAGFTKKSDIIGKTDYEFPWRADVEKIMESDRIVMETKKTISREEKAQVAGAKQESIFLSQKSPLYDSNNKIIGIIGISFDITDRKQMEEELRVAKEQAEAASHAKTEFIANMGHDIRTPLTGIIGFSRALEEEIQDAEEQEYAHQIYQSGEQLLGLLNGVLDLITVDSTNEDQILHQSFDVRRVIQDVLELEKPAVKARQLDIKSDIAPDVPQYVIADRMKLHRILLNLTGNAIKFTKSGFISLNARLLEVKDNFAKIEFSVKDTGIGIPAELQDKVFDRFFKVSPSYKGLYTGNGIGLHIAQKYVELLHGEIRLTSQVGVGTTFSFVLPLPIGEKPPEKESSIQAPLGKQTVATLFPASTAEHTEVNPNQPQVLLVEDNATAMNVLKMMVKRYHVQIHTAVDAESAFELVQKQPMDLIISDLGLPKMQGDELAKQIRAFEKAQNRKPATIVGLTGHGLGEINETCLKAGMNEVYRKPIEPAALKTLIDRFTKLPSLTSASTASPLGPDLPNTETELFQLDKFPLFDLEVGISTLGDEATVREILASLKADAVDQDLELIKQAHAENNWDKVQELAHKIKGGATFGTVRMYYALLYLERYRKAGHTARFEELYQQMLQVIDESMMALQNWLKNQ